MVPGRYGLDCIVKSPLARKAPSFESLLQTEDLRFDGKSQSTVGIGAYPELSLQDARDPLLMRIGGKPAPASTPVRRNSPRSSAMKSRSKLRLLFNEAAEMVITERSKNWKTAPAHQKRVGEVILRREVYPKIGHLARLGRLQKT